MLLIGLWALGAGVAGMLDPSAVFALPPESWVGCGLVLLIAAAVTLKYESTWRLNHSQMWMLYLFFYICFVLRVLLYAVM
jgi:hypothetical protein